MHIRDEINLRVLKGHEAGIRGIRKQTPYVVLYNYSITEGSWAKLPYEGTLFVYETQARLCGYRILNRLSLDCFSRDIESDQDVMETEGYIIHRTGEDIWGIWIWDSKDRADLFAAMQRAGRRSRKTAAGKSKPVVERVKEPIPVAVLAKSPTGITVQEARAQPMDVNKEAIVERSKPKNPEHVKEKVHVKPIPRASSPKRRQVPPQAVPDLPKQVDLTQKEPEEGFSEDGLDVQMSELEHVTGAQYDPESFERGLVGAPPAKPPKVKKVKEKQARSLAVREAPQKPVVVAARPQLDLTMKEPEEGFSETDAPALLGASKTLDVNAMFAHAAQLQAVQSDYDSADMYKR